MGTLLAFDNLHLTEAGYKAISEYIYEWMKTLNVYSKNITVSYPKYDILGDINGDGKVGSQDYLSIISYLQGGITLNSDQLKLADVNLDGFINSLDYIELKKNIIN